MIQLSIFVDEILKLNVDWVAMSSNFSSNFEVRFARGTILSKKKSKNFSPMQSNFRKNQSHFENSNRNQNLSFSSILRIRSIYFEIQVLFQQIGSLKLIFLNTIDGILIQTDHMLWCQLGKLRFI